MTTYLGLPLLAFPDRTALRRWLDPNHATSAGVWVRVFRVGSHHPSVTFEELLDLGLCFGWSESLRHTGDTDSYYQRFTPRRTIGTTSKRNLERAQELIASGEMTQAGLDALGLERP